MPVQQSPSNTTPSQQEQFILIVAAIILPPLAIFLSKKYSIWNKEFRIYHDEEHVQPKENQILTANDLPSYDDIVGSSEGTTEHRDVKGGDNKIQH